jgi:hypothetical protein
LASSIGTGTSNTKDQGNADIGTHRTDVDELFSCITVMSVVCRALVLSYNQLQKETVVSDEDFDLTLEKLLSYLPLGTTSDVANSLLEAVEQCTAMWRRRFENMAFLDTGAEEEGVPKNAQSASQQARNTVEGTARTYLTQEKPSLPCRSFFEVLNQKQKFQMMKVQGQAEADNSVFYSLFFPQKQ